VLQVISGSVSDPKPVFDKILDSCQRLFGATDLAVFLTEDEQLQIAAQRGGFLAPSRASRAITRGRSRARSARRRSGRARCCIVAR
jgi:hypothetical protein